MNEGGGCAASCMSVVPVFSAHVWSFHYVNAPMGNTFPLEDAAFAHYFFFHAFTLGKCSVRDVTRLAMTSKYYTFLVNAILSTMSKKELDALVASLPVFTAIAGSDVETYLHAQIEKTVYCITDTDTSPFDWKGLPRCGRSLHPYRWDANMLLWVSPTPLADLPTRCAVALASLARIIHPQDGKGTTKRGYIRVSLLWPPGALGDGGVRRESVADPECTQLYPLIQPGVEIALAKIIHLREQRILRYHMRLAGYMWDTVARVPGLPTHKRRRCSAEGDKDLPERKCARID